MEVENLTRAVVEQVLDMGELLMADLAEVHALGQELAHQAVGVLVGAALPRAVWVAEEDVDLQVGAQGFVQRHLRALVVGHGQALSSRECF